MPWTFSTPAQWTAFASSPLTAISPAWWPVLENPACRSSVWEKTKRQNLSSPPATNLNIWTSFTPTNRKKRKKQPRKKLPKQPLPEKKTVLSPIWISSNKPSPPSWKSFPTKTAGSFPANWARSEEHTSELQSRFDLVCRLLLEKKK